MGRIYGYCRISRKSQNIERQERNILAAYPAARISREAYTGTKIQGRKALDTILRQIRPGDTLVFDSVSRMSRNAEEGFDLYQKLYGQGMEIVFLKEPHCNTSVYREAMQTQIKVDVNTGDAATDELMSTIIAALNRYQMELAKRQIEIAFQQAQKEVDDLHIRTAEGIETARRAGKQIGQKSGATLHVKKKQPAMNIIRKHSRSFDGTLTDAECIKLTGIAPNTYYKYKRELRQEITEHI